MSGVWSRFSGGSGTSATSVPNTVVNKGGQMFECESQCGECDGENYATVKRVKLSVAEPDLTDASTRKESPVVEAKNDRELSQDVSESTDQKADSSWETENPSASDHSDGETNGSTDSSSVSASSCSSALSLPSSLEINGDFALDFAENAAENGVSPRDILRDLLPPTYFNSLPDDWSEGMLWRLVDAVTTPRRRALRSDVKSLNDAAKFLHSARRILVVSGAGLSVNAGVPDFRSPRGVYATIRQRYPETFGNRPESLFDIDVFRRDPRPFYAFAREILPGKFKPTHAHAFLKLLEARGALLRNYSQNIDMLETLVQVDRVIHCHGSFATATCQTCGARYPLDAYRDAVERGEVPHCVSCYSGDKVPNATDGKSQCDNAKSNTCDATSAEMLKAKEYDVLDAESPLEGHPADSTCRPHTTDSGVLKPDIVFFGENLPNAFYDSFEEDRSACDLLIVIGSSMKVRPVALIPNAVGRVPQILINNEPLSNSSCAFDVELIGDCDVVCSLLTQKLLELDKNEESYSNQSIEANAPNKNTESLKDLPQIESETSGVSKSPSMAEQIMIKNQFVRELVESAVKLHLEEVSPDFTDEAAAKQAINDDGSDNQTVKELKSAHVAAPRLEDAGNQVSLFGNDMVEDVHSTRIEQFLKTLSFENKFVHVSSDQRRYFFKGCSIQALWRSCRKQIAETLIFASDSPNSSSESSN